MIELWVRVSAPNEIRTDYYKMSSWKKVKVVLRSYRDESYEKQATISYHWHEEGFGCHSSAVIGVH